MSYAHTKKSPFKILPSVILTCRLIMNAQGTAALRRKGGKRGLPSSRYG